MMAETLRHKSNCTCASCDMRSTLVKHGETVLAVISDHSAWGHQSVVLPPGRIAIALAYWIPVLFGADVLFCIASDRDLAVTTNKQLYSPRIVGEFHSEIAVRQKVNGIREL